MKKKIALILAAVGIFSVLAAGCGGGSGTPSDKQELTLNLGSEPPELDSAKTTDQVSFTVLNQTMEGLVRIGEDYDIEPGVAKTWDVSPDKLTYTFHLRDDAKWSDDKPVTAADYKYAWLRAMDPLTTSEYAFVLTDYIKGAAEFNAVELNGDGDDYKDPAKAKEARDAVAIETPDDHTLKVTLNHPTPYFMSMMAFPTYFPQRQDVVEQHGDKFGAEADKMVYNGPFTVTEWVHEDHVTIEKNPKYWDADAVKLEKVNFKMIKESNTAIQMFDSGEFDRIGVPGSARDKYKDDPGFYTLPEATTFWINFNLDHEKLQNVNLRKAIYYAIDRKAYADNVLKNGSVPAEGPVPAMMEGLDDKSFRDIAGGYYPVEGDKEKAKEYWEKAKKELGINELTLEFLIDDSDHAKKTSEALQAMIQETLEGLKVELQPVTFKIRLERTNRREYDIVFSGWGADYNDPSNFLDLWLSDSPFNDPHWENAKYDQLMKSVKSEPDEAKRMETMAEAEKLLMEELPSLPIYHRTRMGVKKPYVKGIRDFAIGSDYDLKYAYVEGK